MNRQLLFNRYSSDHELFPGSCKPRAACCIRCGGTLREGFIVDPPQGYEPAMPTAWQPGSAGIPSLAGTPFESAQQRRVVAKRCEDCGSLELFAP